MGSDAEGVTDLDREHEAALPVPGGSYSHVRKRAGFVAVSGQSGHDAAGRLSENLGEQTRQALANLAACLASVDLELADVVQTHVFMADIECFDEMDSIYAQAFTTGFPARTTIQAGLGVGLLVEIEAIAISVAP